MIKLPLSRLTLRTSYIRMSSKLSALSFSIISRVVSARLYIKKKKETTIQTFKQQNFLKAI